MQADIDKKPALDVTKYMYLNVDDSYQMNDAITLNKVLCSKSKDEACIIIQASALLITFPLEFSFEHKHIISFD